MDRIRQAAQTSILRALGFTALAIGTFMAGLSFEPALCFGTGATLTGIAAAVLWWKGAQAPTRGYRKTEVWILLDRDLGLPPERAQEAIGGILRELYYHYARITAGLAVAFWLTSLAIRAAF